MLTNGFLMPKTPDIKSRDQGIELKVFGKSTSIPSMLDLEEFPDTFNPKYEISWSRA